MLIGLGSFDPTRSSNVQTAPATVTNPITGQTEVHAVTTNVIPGQGLQITDSNRTTGETTAYTTRSTLFGPKVTASSSFVGPIARPFLPTYISAIAAQPPASAPPPSAPVPEAPPPMIGPGDAAILNATSAADQAMINAQNIYASEKKQAELTVAGGAAVAGVAYFKGSLLLGLAAGVVALFGASRFKRASDTYQQAQAAHAATMIEPPSTIR